MAGIKKLSSGTVPSKESGESVCKTGPMDWQYGANGILTVCPGGKC